MTAICVCFRHHPVHKSVEFGVQNALKRIFEHFQTTWGLYHLTLRWLQTVFDLPGVGPQLQSSLLNPSFKGPTLQMGYCNLSLIKPFLSIMHGCSS